MKNYLFFDTASTTKCCEPAAECLIRYSVQDFGNPSSVHCFGQETARAVREARTFFADAFQVAPEQVIFTGSGTEANNLAILGTTFALQTSGQVPPESDSEVFQPQVIASSVEHAAVRNTVLSLMDFGIPVGFIPMENPEGIQVDRIQPMLSPKLRLVSIQTVNNIVGTPFDVVHLASWIKERCPSALFHTDAIQAFGKVPVATSKTAVDLVSLSGHKICGPKGIGALIILNKALLKGKIRPLIWGGEQEGGLRSGTQSPALIAAFHKAAELALKNQSTHFEKVTDLRNLLEKLLLEHSLIGTPKAPLRWNSPAKASPYIINLSAPGFPAGAFAQLLEERGCLISVGSACSSSKSAADPVLAAMNFPKEVQNSAFRISLSPDFVTKDIHTLVTAIEDSILHMKRLSGKSPRN